MGSISQKKKYIKQLEDRRREREREQHPCTQLSISVLTHSFTLVHFLGCWGDKSKSEGWQAGLGQSASGK